jgi:hypothetical protein
MNYKPVLSKRDFVRRYEIHEFGNHSPTWNTIDEFAVSKYVGNVHIRNRVTGGPTWYDLPIRLDWVESKKQLLSSYALTTEDFLLCWETACENCAEENLYISAMCPTERTILQGEVCQWPGGPYLYYTTVRKPMREALRQEAKHATGIVALEILKCVMCPNSYDWLQELFVRYPNHVVEFTSLEINWGTQLNHNTLFWEIRNY